MGQEAPPGFATATATSLSNSAPSAAATDQTGLYIVKLGNTLTTEEMIVAAGGQLTGGGTVAGDLANNGIVLDTSLVRCTSASKSGATFTVTIQGDPSHTYQMQRANSLTPATWVNVGSAQSPTTNNQTLTFADSSATGSRYFYRITLTP